MTDTHLFNTLHAGEVEEAELTQILSEHFQGAAQFSEDEITYPGHQTDFALTLVYRKDRLADIRPGPRLTAQDVETLQRRVDEELLASPGARVGAEILFANLPVTGWFRYRDAFQLLPVPPQAPRPPFLMGEHPFLLEFRFPDSTNWQIRRLRRAIRGRQVELALAGLLEGSIHSLGTITRHHWVVPPHTEGETWTVAYCQEMYTSPDILLERDEFSSVEELPRLEALEPSSYYARLGIRPGESLKIPNTLESLLNRLYALTPKWRDRFLRGCFWFQHASRVHASSRSAAFTALISAVEALMPEEQSAGRCPACGRPSGKGPTQRFADFVAKYALPGDGLEAERKKFYAIRSKLSHGGTLLHSDYSAWSPGLTPKQTGEWADSRAAWHLVEAVLVNWLSCANS